MIEKNNTADLREVFSRLLLIGTVFTPFQPGSEQGCLDQILAGCGFTLMRSDCRILEKDRIGDSLITIARYSLEFRGEGDSPGRTSYLEGDLAMQADNRGNVSISISAKPGIPPSQFDTIRSSESSFGDEADPAPFFS